MLTKALNIGEAHGHTKRIIDSKVVNSETVAPMYYLFKDHKEKESWRPVVSGFNSNTLGLSNLLSDVVESICLSVKNPYEVISGEDLLSRVESFNKWVTGKIESESELDNDWDWRLEYMLIGSDVVSLFPSLTAENTAKAVRARSSMVMYVHPPKLIFII